MPFGPRRPFATRATALRGCPCATVDASGLNLTTGDAIAVVLYAHTATVGAPGARAPVVVPRGSVAANLLDLEL